MTDEERKALRLLVSEARRDWVPRRLVLLDECQRCHEPFERRRTHQMYCSSSCRQEAWRIGASTKGDLRAPAPPGASLDAKGAVIRTHSRAGYMRGCRCDTCRAAHTRYMRTWRERAA